MFKKALLTLTALTAIFLAQAPHISTADAAIKITPATEKLKTTVREKADNVRVKKATPKDTASPSGHPEYPGE